MRWRRLPQLALWSQLGLKHWSNSSAWRQGKYSAQSEWKQCYSTVLYISFMPYGMWMYMTIFEYLIVQKKVFLWAGMMNEELSYWKFAHTHTYIHTLSLSLDGYPTVAICSVPTSSVGPGSSPPTRTKRPSWPSTSSTVFVVLWPGSWGVPWRTRYKTLSPFSLSTSRATTIRESSMMSCLSHHL